jgi:outer membrane scaffolding protein for murein synthesis (MipA/OmpV family)
VRADRPAYAAKGGYSGFSVLFSASRKLGDDWWFGGFMRYDDLHGVEFEDSPLVVERDALLVGIGLARIFYRSEAPAAH